MNIIELEIYNICECKHVLLKMPTNLQKSPLYLVHSNQKCEIITLALQLICGVKYGTFAALHEIRDKIFNGKVKITFTLPKSNHDLDAEENFQQQDQSIDSDVPCTSREAHQRLQDRLKRKSEIERQKNTMVINACRDFTLNPDLIVYTVDGGLNMECSVIKFQIRFFTCTDIIFPRLMNITHGEYCNGRWLDLLSTEFIEKERDENSLLKEFCKLYAKRKIPQSHVLNELTTSVFTARSFLNNSRISHLINIFNDIRWIFEYITCSEFTVWFFLPTVFGNLQDISQITTENANFELMKTQIQLKQKTATAFPWTQAEKYVQELLLVAVQLAFGYHCQQNIIYLHSLNYLEKHQSFEFLNYSLIQSSSCSQVIFEKNYFNRIFHLCAKLNVCCVLEYCGGLLSYPSQAYIINCSWLDFSKQWQISVRDCSSSPEASSNTAQYFQQQLEKTLK